MGPSMQHPEAVRSHLDWTILSSVVLFGLIATLGAFLLEGHAGFNLGDEGYLWYGVQRVLHGEVPIRDFMSYDPARYYWAAGLLWLFHANGLIAVRAATAASSVQGYLSWMGRLAEWSRVSAFVYSRCCCACFG